MSFLAVAILSSIVVQASMGLSFCLESGFRSRDCTSGGPFWDPILSLLLLLTHQTRAILEISLQCGYYAFDVQREALPEIAPQLFVFEVLQFFD